MLDCRAVFGERKLKGAATSAASVRVVRIGPSPRVGFLSKVFGGEGLSLNFPLLTSRVSGERRGFCGGPYFCLTN